MITVREIKISEAFTASEIEKRCLSTAWSQKQIKELPDTAVYLAAFYGETMCGIASMYCVFDEGQIMNVAVLPEFRRKGVADALMAKLIKTAEERKLAILTLEVAEDNLAATGLYEKQGFSVSGKRKGFYKNADALLMEKTL